MKVEPEQQNGVEREQATFRCTAKGSPRPKIQWRLTINNKALVSGRKYEINENGSLTIKHLDYRDPTDAGSYYCVGSNVVGLSESFGHLNVRGKNRTFFNLPFESAFHTTYRLNWGLFGIWDT